MHRECIGGCLYLNPGDGFGQRLLVVELLLHQDRLIGHDCAHGADKAFIRRRLRQHQRQVVDWLDLAHHLLPRRRPADVESPTLAPIRQRRVDDQRQNRIRLLPHPPHFFLMEDRRQDQVAILDKKFLLFIRQCTHDPPAFQPRH